MRSVEQIIEIVNSLKAETSYDVAEIDVLISEIRTHIGLNKENGKVIGPFISKLTKIKKIKLDQVEYNKQRATHSNVIDKESNWVKVGNGFLKIGHKPGSKRNSIELLLNDKTDTVLTILSEREGAVSIGEKCKAAGIDWFWLPLPNASIPSNSIKKDIITVYEKLKDRLNQGQKIFIHCAAGIHRTGMITHAFLLFLGYDNQTSFKILSELRPLTANDAGEHRLAWGKQFVSTSSS